MRSLFIGMLLSVGVFSVPAKSATQGSVRMPLVLQSSMIQEALGTSVRLNDRCNLRNLLEDVATTCPSSTTPMSTVVVEVAIR